MQQANRRKGARVGARIYLKGSGQRQQMFQNYTFIGKPNNGMIDNNIVGPNLSTGNLSISIRSEALYDNISMLDNTMPLQNIIFMGTL
jgi:hypothetical protein